MSGKVKLGTDVESGRTAALKFIDRSKLTERDCRSLEREVSAMRTLNHPNILKLHEAVESVKYPRKRGGFKDMVLLVLEMLSGGELLHYLMHTGAFPEEVARTYFQQLMNALQTCHSEGIYHRDLKPENLILDESFNLKIADFGLSFVASSARDICATSCGTQSYMAPEVVAHAEYDGAKADVWSAGIVLFIMLSGNPPLGKAQRGDWWYDRIRKNQHRRFWDYHLQNSPSFPPGAVDFLNLVFKADPAERATLAELAQHPWIQGPVCTPEQLRTIISGKQRIVEHVKERQLAEARAQQAARQPAGGYTPFGQDTNRAVEDLELLDDHHKTYFYTTEDPTKVLKRVDEVLLGLGAKDVVIKDEKFKIKATLMPTTPTSESSDEADEPTQPLSLGMGGEPLQIAAQILAIPNEPGLSALAFEMRDGDQMSFLKLFQGELSHQLRDVIISADAAKGPSEEPVSDAVEEDVF